MVVAGSCREAPPYIDPSRYAQAGNPTPGAAKRVFAATLPAGDPLPDEAAAEALQTGWYCLALPPAIRPRLLPATGDHWLRAVEKNAAGHWQVLAVDLAARTATRETALADPRDCVLAAEWTLGRTGPAAEPTPTAASGEPDGWAPPAAEIDRSIAWLQMCRHGQCQDLAGDATHVADLTADATAAIAAFVDAPPDATPALWTVALAEGATPLQFGAAERVWAIVDEGHAAVVRGRGPFGLETQLVSLPDGATRAIGPDSRAVLAVADALLLETWQGKLMRVLVPSGQAAWLGTGNLPARVVDGGGQPAVTVADDPSSATLYWFDGERLRRATRIGPAAWVAAMPLQGGVLAALVGRDSDGSGAYEPMRDAADICVLARAVGALAMPLGP